MVIFDILKEIYDKSDNPIKVCKKVLNEWRELLYHEAGVVPEKNNIIGIIGELRILRELIKYRDGSINLWTGPYGGRYDFYSGKFAVEVKSSIQRKGRIITIHGHDQLERPGNGNLYLIYQKFEEVPNGGETIESMVTSIVSLGCDKYKLWEALYNIKVYPDILPQCNHIQLKLLEDRVYEVNDGFPSITSKSFKSDILPNQVLSITYTLDLSSEPPFPLQRGSDKIIFSQMVME